MLSQRHVLFSVLVASTLNTYVFGALFNKDVKQQFADPQDNYEVVLDGDWRINNPNTINAFANGSVQASYNAGADTTTISFAGDPIAQNLGNFKHFGYGLLVFPKKEVPILLEYWTRGAIETNTPACSTAYSGNLATQNVTVTLRNDSSRSITLTNSEYTLSPTSIPLADMNRTLMGPGSGEPTGITHPAVLPPGASVQFLTPKGSLTSTIVTFIQIENTPPLSGGEYDDEVGIWTQATPLDIEAIPAVSTWGLVALTLVMLAAGTVVLRRRVIA